MSMLSPATGRRKRRGRGGNRFPSCPWVAVLLLWSGCASEPQHSRIARGAAGRIKAEAAPTTPPTASRSVPTAAAAPVATASADRPVRFTSGISLWGEVPGAPTGGANDASDNLRQVSFTREGADFDVDIDPTGRWVVFASTRHHETADLYLKRVDGNTVTKLTSDPANDVMPAFSPDGRSIAFASDRSGNWDIYVQGIDGGQPVQLTNDPAQELHPHFSPDGALVVFCSRGHSGRWELIVVETANPATRKIIGLGLFPRFSPDGDKIVFQRARTRGSRHFSIWTVDFVNGEGVRPTEIAAATNAAAINPAWSPDGRRIAFATVLSPSAESGDRPDAADLWAINLDGTSRVKLTNDRYANLQPVWAEDGTIYFVSNRSGWDNIWALRPDEQAPWLAVPRDGPDGDSQAAVTPP